MVQPVLLFKTGDVAALGNDAAVAVAAAAGLTHVEADFVLTADSSQVEVRGEHTGSHVAHLGTDDVPGTGVEFFLDAVSRELDDTAGHVFVLVAGVAPDGAEPCGTLTELGNVPLIVVSADVGVVGVIAGAGGHVEAVRGLGDGGGAFLPVRLEDAHELEQVRGERGNVTDAELVGVFLVDQFAPGRFDSLVFGDDRFQCHNSFLPLCLGHVLYRHHYKTRMVNRPSDKAFGFGDALPYTLYGSVTKVWKDCLWRCTTSFVTIGYGRRGCP